MKRGCIDGSARPERPEVAGDKAIEVRTEVRAGEAGLSYNHSQSIHRAG